MSYESLLRETCCHGYYDWREIFRHYRLHSPTCLKNVSFSPASEKKSLKEYNSSWQYLNTRLYPKWIQNFINFAELYFEHNRSASMVHTVKCRVPTRWIPIGQDMLNPTLTKSHPTHSHSNHTLLAAWIEIALGSIGQICSYIPLDLTPQNWKSFSSYWNMKDTISNQE